MSKKTCIIHYPQINVSNINKLISVAKSRYKELLIQSKLDRQKLNGSKLHDQQCAGIPENIWKDSDTIKNVEKILQGLELN